jgi:hypothetical protein
MRPFPWKCCVGLCSLAALVAMAATALGQQPGTLIDTFKTSWPANTIENRTGQAASPLCEVGTDAVCTANPFSGLGPGAPITFPASAGTYRFVHAGGAGDYPCFTLPCSLGPSVVVNGPNNPSLCGRTSTMLNAGLECVHAGGQIALFYGTGVPFDPTGSFDLTRVYLIASTSPPSPPPPGFSIASGDQQIGLLSSVLPKPLVVQMIDQSNAPVPGVSITFALTQLPAGTTGAALTPLTTVTARDGTASTQLTLGAIPGRYQVTASCASCMPQSVIFTASAGCQPQITSPLDGSAPQSQFVAVYGVAASGAHINLLMDNEVVGTTQGDADGQWEMLVAPPPDRYQHQLQAQCVEVPDLSNAINVTRNSTPPPTQLQDTSPFLLMKTADIVVASVLGSPQTSLYGPTYTVAALYLGGEMNGTPLVAEAVTAPEASGSDQVRTRTLELSAVYQNAASVAVFRPTQPLTHDQRTAIVSWAQTTTARRLPYWDVLKDIVVPIRQAWLVWDPKGQTPHVPKEFDTLMAQVRSNTESTDKFIGSTLVWRAYLEGTAGAVDLSQPNDLRATSSGSFLEQFSDPVFLEQLSKNKYIVPGTLAHSPQLRQVQ